MEQHDVPPSAFTIGWRGRLHRIGFWRRLLRGIARFATAVCGIWLLIAVVYAAYSGAGSIRHSLHHAHSIGNVLMIALIVWAATSDLLLNVARADWRSWGWYPLAALALFSLNVFFAFRNVVFYPEHVLQNLGISQQPSSDPVDTGPNQTAIPIDRLAAKCRQALPPDARILFQGSHDAWVFAYEVYPRKVFRLPGEAFQQGASLQAIPCLRAFPKDPVEGFWHHHLPSSSQDREAFIRDHRITHEVDFQADDSTTCPWKAVR